MLGDGRVAVKRLRRRVDDPEVARPGGEGRRGVVDRSTGLELPDDGGDYKRGELGAAVDAHPGDLVANPGVGESLEHRGDVLLPGMTGDLNQRRKSLADEQLLEEPRNRRYCHRLVDIREASLRREVCHTRVPSVEKAQLVELPVFDVVCEQRADLVPGRPAPCEVILHYPLSEGFADDGPEVVDASAVAQPSPIGSRCHGRDAVDHRVGEGAVLVHPRW